MVEATNETRFRRSNMNFIMKGVHAALEPLRYTPVVATHHAGTNQRPAGVGGLLWSLGHRRRVRRAIRELNSLSDATLKDIGVERGNIANVVEEMLEPAPLPHKRSESPDTDYSLTGGAAA